MRQLLSLALLLSTVFGTAPAIATQAPAAPTSAQTAEQTTAPAATAASPANTSSAILQPALTDLQAALGTLHTEKWKAPVRLRDETDANIRSMRRDMDTVLPPLLAEADAAPDSVVAGLPVLRNIEALYNVLLRVAVTGKASAPAPQSAVLEQAMMKLDEARRTLGDRVQAAAAAKEKQVTDLEAALRAVPPPAAPLPVATPPLAPERKRTPRRKPAPKPAPAAVAPAIQ